MQPPPRKVKPSVSLKNIQTDQVSKLNIKHQQECDLLEDMRTFFSRKAALEKEYAQGLLKVTSQLLKREFPAQPDLSSEDGQEHKTVCAVWRTILEESDKLAKARLQVAEVYSESAAEPLKPAKTAKVQCFKKVMPQLSVIHTEVAQCVMDLVKTQKTYMTEGSVAHESRQKSSEADDKLKRKSTGIFQSLASLQKSCSKLRARTDASEVKETAARNEYLLSLAAANAHQIRYYSTDLPEIMKTLDCDVYEKIQESLTVAGQAAAEIAENEANFFRSIAIEAAKICREFSQQCYLFQNPVFTNLVQYQFEPCLGDTCNKLTSDHSAGPDLEKEARKWSTRVAKETRAIRDYYRQLTLLQSAKTGSSDSGNQDPAVADPEAKLEELKQSIRKAETAKLKAEARLEALRLGGVNVDEWINQAQMESLVAEESGLARTPSQVSLRTESSGGQSGNDDHEPTYTHYDDDDDFIDDTFNTTSNRSGRVYPLTCSALYDFQASNYDEMTIKAGEQLELVADGDGEGWVKAKNLLGQEGYIPETYVNLSGQSDTHTPASIEVEAMNAINETISESVKPPAPAASPQQRQQPQPAVRASSPDLQSPTSGDLQQDTASSYSSGDLEVQQTTEVMATGKQPLPATVVTSTEISWAHALFDYEAQTEEELSFLEGALIRILRKDDGGVDDGFWEGECNGNIGVFPSLVVEEFVGPPDDPLSPGMMPTHPDFSVPPPVHVTLPTPENEPPPPPSASNGEDSPQSTPTPTADQSPKRVRFEQQGGGKYKYLHQQLHLHNQQHQNPPKHQQHVVQTTGRQNSSCTGMVTGRHPRDQTVLPSPILRHKSLPSMLDTPRSGDLQVEKQCCESSQSDLSTSHIKHQQNLSCSQPQLSLAADRSPPPAAGRSPPPSRKLILQQQKHHLQQLKKLQLTQHYQSNPEHIMSSSRDCEESGLDSVSLSEAQSHRGHHQFGHSYSYPNSPLASPQKDDQTTLLQMSIQPQIAGQSSSDTQHKPLLHFQLYQQNGPDLIQRHHNQLSPTHAVNRSLTLDTPQRPSATHHRHSQASSHLQHFSTQPQSYSTQPQSYLMQAQSYSTHPALVSPQSQQYSTQAVFVSPQSQQYSTQPQADIPRPKQYSSQPQADNPQPNQHPPQSPVYNPLPKQHSPHAQTDASTFWQPSYPEYTNMTHRPAPQHHHDSYQPPQNHHDSYQPPQHHHDSYQPHQQHHRSIHPSQADFHGHARTPDKLSIFHVNVDDWESDEGEESLV